MGLIHPPISIPTTISPGEIYGMQLFVILFFGQKQLVEIKAISSSGSIDSIFCDTSLSET
jgi:hypothetical protein